MTTNGSTLSRILAIGGIAHRAREDGWATFQTHSAEFPEPSEMAAALAPGILVVETSVADLEEPDADLLRRVNEVNARMVGAWVGWSSVRKRLNLRAALPFVASRPLDEQMLEARVPRTTSLLHHVRGAFLAGRWWENDPDRWTAGCIRFDDVIQAFSRHLALRALPDGSYEATGAGANPEHTAHISWSEAGGVRYDAYAPGDPDFLPDASTLRSIAAINADLTRGAVLLLRGPDGKGRAMYRHSATLLDLSALRPTGGGELDAQYVALNVDAASGAWEDVARVRREDNAALLERRAAELSTVTVGTASALEALSRELRVSPPISLTEPWRSLEQMDYLLRERLNSPLPESARASLHTWVMYYVGALVMERWGGSWMVQAEPLGRAFGQYVLGDLRVRASARVNPAAVAAAVVAGERLPRILEALDRDLASAP